MAKNLIPGIPHLSSKVITGPSPKFGAPKPGTPDTEHILGAGVHSKFFTPKNPVVPKSGASGLNLGLTKVKPAKPGSLSSAFPPKLPKVPV